ncbi:hypothetical protein ACLKA6_006692 [Drosophila palustris]
MGRQRLLQWLQIYSLALGVTSQRLVDGRVQQTWLTRAYTLIINALELLLLPGMFYLTAQYIEKTSVFQNLMPYTCYILYSVSYATIAYTVISRGKRDSAFLELERIVNRIMSQQVHQVGRSLNFIYCLKLSTMIILCVNSTVLSFMVPNAKNWNVYLITFLFQNSMIIPVIATYRYFLALWHIACCYQSINCRVEELVSSFKMKLPTRSELEEVHRLWSQHSMLGSCTLRMNQVYGVLLLAARFDYLTFSVINQYWGMLFMFAIETPIYMVMFGTFNYCIRFIDFFLLDDMCDLTIKAQNYPHHVVTEGNWFKEINAYIMYVNTSKLDLSVCGLYTANRIRWFKLFGSIAGSQSKECGQNTMALPHRHAAQWQRRDILCASQSVTSRITKKPQGPGVVTNATGSQAQEPL